MPCPTAAAVGHGIVHRVLHFAIFRKVGVWVGVRELLNHCDCHVMPQKMLGASLSPLVERLERVSLTEELPNINFLFSNNIAGFRT